MRNAYFKRLICLLMTAVLFAMLGISVSASEIGGISGKAAVLYEPESGSFLYKKSADVRMPMASTTKIMTAIVAMENSELSDVVTVDGRAVGTEGSSAYLSVGEELTMEELLYALLLQSANDAAVAIACHIGGDIDGFAEMMNAKALELGLTDTHFTNPHGLDDGEHYTTAGELAIIAAELLKDPTLKRIVSTYKKTFATDERRRTYVNHNKLLKLYDGAIGVKTGFTKKCGRCLVGAAERDGLTLITVTLDAPDDWRDHAAMLDHGFEAVEKITLATPCDHLYEIAVTDGDADLLTVKNAVGLSRVLPRGEHKVEEYVKLSRFVTAPVNEGEILGRVVYTVDGEYVGEVPLVAEKSVTKTDDRSFMERLLSKIFG